MSWWRRKRWARLRRGTRLSPNCDASTLLTVNVTAKAPWIGGVRSGYARSMRTSLGPSRRPERVRRECSHRNILQCRTMRMPIRPCPIRNECPPSGLPSFYSPTHCCYCKYALNPSVSHTSKLPDPVRLVSLFIPLLLLLDHALELLLLLLEPHPCFIPDRVL